MDDRSLRPRSGASARALLLTILGEFVLPHDRAIWTSTVVRTLETLGVDERNARQAIARLADRGTVHSEKVGRRARWRLTAAGTRLLTDGTKRIYEFGSGNDAWDGRWLVVLCSVPEDQRAKRHQLRSQLEFSGFGFVAPGVAISPHLDREGVANAVLGELDLLPQAVVFRAEAGELVSTDELLERAWDLDRLADRYSGFIGDFSVRTAEDEETRFAACVELVHEWRRFPLVDPEIPPRLLPADWPSHRAKELFDTLHRRWSPDANRWYESVERAGE